MDISIVLLLAFVQIFIPEEIRGERFVSFIKRQLGYVGLGKYESLMAVAEEFFYFRYRNRKYLPYSGQVLSLETLLSKPNNIYPGATVTIEDAVKEDKVYWHNTEEPFDPEYLANTPDDRDPDFDVTKWNEEWDRLEAEMEASSLAHEETERNL